MKIYYSRNFIRKLKKSNVRIRKNLREKITLFQKNPNEPQLNNHALREPYKGLKSIDITNDYRALYREKDEEGNTVAYFEDVGTHKDLYGQVPS